MNTLRRTRGKYLLVLIAMCGLVASALGILTNTAGVFFDPIARDFWVESVRRTGTGEPDALLGTWRFADAGTGAEIKLTLNGDGTFALADGADAGEGTWTYAEGMFTLGAKTDGAAPAYTALTFDEGEMGAVLSGAGDRSVKLDYVPATAGVNMTLTISNLIFALAGMAAARFIGAKNFKLSLIAGTALFAGGTAALSLCHGLWPMYILNGVRGFAAGLVGNVLATTVIGYWFATDTGFISSLALGFSGLVGALFNPVLNAVIGAAGWRTAYLVSAAAILALNLPSILLPIAFRPQDCRMEALRAEAPAKKKSGREARPARTGDSRSAAVLLIAVLGISVASLVCATPQLFRSIAGSYGLAGTGVTMMTVALIANTGGKFLFGAMTDRLGVKTSILIYGTVIGAGIALLGFIRQPLPMLLSAACIGLCYSIPTVGAVMISRELFSPERYSRVFPKINLGGTVANALGYPLMGAIYDATHSYAGALILVFAMIALCMTCVVTAYLLAAREKASRERSR